MSHFGVGDGHDHTKAEDEYVRKDYLSDDGCLSNDIMWMLWFSEMPMSVVDALLTEPLMLLKAEEVKVNKYFEINKLF